VHAQIIMTAQASIIQILVRELENFLHAK